MKKVQQLVNVLKFASKTNTSQKVKEIFLKYYYSLALQYQFITQSKLKQVWPYSIYNNKKQLDKAYRKLLEAIAKKENFLQIAGELFRKPWLPLYVDAAKIHPDCYREHFLKHKDKYTELITQTMFQVMLNTKDTSELVFLGYTKFDHEKMPSSAVYRPSRFWCVRQYYHVVKMIDEQWAKDIHQQAQNIYSIFLDEDDLLKRGNIRLKDLFVQMRTVYGKLELIDKMWENLVVTDEKGMQINAEKLTAHQEDLLSILGMILSSGNKVLIENITALVLAIHLIGNPVINKFKQESVILYEQHGHLKYVKENLESLKRL